MFFLYELSNWSVNLAGMLIVQQLLRNGGTKKSNGESSFMISHDTMMVLFIGQLARVYWGLSPPEIWLHDETVTTKIVVLVDFAFSLFLWALIAVLSFQRSLSQTKVPWKLTWPVLTLASLAIAVPASLFVEPDEESGVQEHAFLLADYFTVFSLISDVVAILPQL